MNTSLRDVWWQHFADELARTIKCIRLAEERNLKLLTQSECEQAIRCLKSMDRCEHEDDD